MCRAEDTQRILAGQEPTQGSVNTVDRAPAAFADWVREHSARIKDGDPLPYFISDNQKRVKEILENPVTVVSDSKSEYEIARIEANRREYERLKADPNYKDVAFNPDNGGLKATHIGHNFDPVDGHWEKEVVDVGYNNGRCVILGNEYSTIIGERFTEGSWDGLQFEIATRKTATENNILRGLKHCADKRTTEIAILYFPNGGFDIDKLQRGICRYRGYSKFSERTYVKFKKVICFEFDKIVYEKAF